MTVAAPRAVLFDLDGTLYHQPLLRALMAPDLALATAIDRGRTARALLTYRKVREHLRALGRPEEPLERLQYREPARLLKCDMHWLERLVRDWILERPLGRLRYCRRRGLTQLLDLLEHRGIAVGIFSDYPTAAKLEALDLKGRFSIEVCALDPDVNAFKPHPRGFLTACERWGLSPAHVLHVGDRRTVDGVGAVAAGMRVAIVDRLTSFNRIAREIFRNG